jgi:hypothetical protein
VSEDDPRSEAGIGGLVPWADRPWFVGYVAHIAGAGLGLYEVDTRLTMRRHPASVTIMSFRRDSRRIGCG